MSTHSNRENSSTANELSNGNTVNGRNKKQSQSTQQLPSQQQIDTPPNSPDSSEGSKACCFCWCCCCSCSWLAINLLSVSCLLNILLKYLINLSLTVRNEENRNSNIADLKNYSNIEP